MTITPTLTARPQCMPGSVLTTRPVSPYRNLWAALDVGDILQQASFAETYSAHELRDTEGHHRCFLDEAPCTRRVELGFKPRVASLRSPRLNTSLHHLSLLWKFSQMKVAIQPLTDSRPFCKFLDCFRWWRDRLMFYEPRSSSGQLQWRQPARMKQHEICDKIQVQVLALPFTSCVTLGKSLNFSEFLFPYL